MKRLEDLLSSLGSYKVFGNKNILVSGVSDDSRKIKKGNIFVAIKGLNFDGHLFIPQAVSLGATVVAGEEDPKKLSLGNITYVKVGDSQAALGYLCSTWYDYPSKKLTVIGVTGTDGKTTTANLIYSILKKAGKRVGIVSTINAKIGDKSFDTGLHVTNPEPPLLQKFLAKMTEGRCQYAVLEITSHGLDQQRVAGVNFAVGVLTNITHEHLDYHKSFVVYQEAKAKLFAQVKVAVLNNDDKSFGFISRFVPKKGRVVSYGTGKNVDYQARRIEEKEAGIEFELVSSEGKFLIRSNLRGFYNVYNLLAAVAVGRIFNISRNVIQKAILSFKPLRGRLEEIKTGKDFKVYIDFAHTPNALENVLKTLKQKNGRLVVVFGCAGLRDVQKRPMMGEIAARNANLIVLTAEDPRTENIENIIEQIAQGCRQGGAEEKNLNDIYHLSRGRFFFRVSDRKAAIKFAIQKLAKKGDIVVICGKGHEKSMCFGKTEYPWSDQKEARKAVRSLLKTKHAKKQ